MRGLSRQIVELYLYVKSSSKKATENDDLKDIQVEVEWRCPFSETHNNVLISERHVTL